MSTKKKKEPLLIISGVFAAAAVISGSLLIHQLNTTFSQNERNDVVEVEEVEDEFQYTLRANATEFQQHIFEDLKLAFENFTNSNSALNKENYARSVVTNFIADFYTWSNKEGRNDVGGLQFIASEIQSDFQRFAVDNFYLYLNQFIERFGSEKLLTVSHVTIEHIDLSYEIELGPEIDEKTEEVIGVLTENVIRVEATWDYEPTTLEEIDYFQRRATFLLTEENGRLVIRVIEESEESYNY